MWVEKEGQDPIWMARTGNEPTLFFFWKGLPMFEQSENLKYRQDLAREMIASNEAEGTSRQELIEYFTSELNKMERKLRRTRDSNGAIDMSSDAMDRLFPKQTGDKARLAWMTYICALLELGAIENKHGEYGITEIDK